MRIIKEKTLGKQLYGLHLEIVKNLNNLHIVINSLIPQIEMFLESVDPTEDEEDRKFEVPSIKNKSGKAYSYRNQKELHQLLNRYRKRELYEIFYIRAVSAFEDYLTTCLISVLKKYPKKITTSIPDVKTPKTIDIDVLLQSHDYDEVIEKIIQNILETVFYAEPKKYLEYFEKIVSIEINQNLKMQYCEIKATRDIIIHNNGIVNKLYMKKSESLARSEIGKHIPMDNTYFDDSIAILKKLSGEIRKEANIKYPIKT